MMSTIPSLAFVATSLGLFAAPGRPYDEPIPSTASSNTDRATGLTPCTGREDCSDPAASFCNPAGLCVGCGELLDGDAACAAADPERPVCARGACVATIEYNAGTYEGQTGVCSDGNPCESYAEQGQFDGPEDGVRFDSTDVVEAASTTDPVILEPERIRAIRPPEERRANDSDVLSTSTVFEVWAVLWGIARFVFWTGLLGLVQLLPFYLPLRWYFVWRRLPKSLIGPIRSDRRITVEGTIREALETLRVPDRKDESCVAWACHFEVKNDPDEFWTSRSRPFVLELDDGRRIQVDIMPNRWQTNLIGMRPVEVPEREDDEIESLRRLLAWEEQFAEHVANAGREGDDFNHHGFYPHIPERDEDEIIRRGFLDPLPSYGHWQRRISTMAVGDRVTISGVFLPAPGEVTTHGYREIAAENGYVVLPLREMPRPRRPTTRSLHRQGQVRGKFPFPPVLMFHGRCADGLARGGEFNRGVLQMAAAWAFMAGFVECGIWFAWKALR